MQNTTVTREKQASQTSTAHILQYRFISENIHSPTDAGVVNEDRLHAVTEVIKVLQSHCLVRRLLKHRKWFLMAHLVVCR